LNGLNKKLWKSESVVGRPGNRVARWLDFRTKNPNLGKFLRMENVHIFYGHFLYLSDIIDYLWFILCSFGTFLPALVLSTKKNLATLPGNKSIENRSKK
jgi:hypothetical protein